MKFHFKQCKNKFNQTVCKAHTLKTAEQDWEKLKKTSMAASKKVKHRVITQPSRFPPRKLPQRNENICPHKALHKSTYYMIERISLQWRKAGHWLPVAGRKGGGLHTGTGTFRGQQKCSFILILSQASEGYRTVKTHQMIQSKWMLLVLKLFCNNVVEKNK